MEDERPLRVVFFKALSGNELVREWLQALPRDERHVIGEDLLTVQYAWPVGKPLVDHLGDGLGIALTSAQSRRPNPVLRRPKRDRRAPRFHQKNTKDAGTGTGPGATAETHLRRSL